jgi:DNA-binding Lrp family transcriptional regulator
MRASDKTLRIQKIMLKHPEMTDAQIARKIGMDSPEGRERVAKERPKQEEEEGELQ